MASSSGNTHGLIGVAYLPHGAMLLDPQRADLPDAARDLHACCMKISETIAELTPDLVILLTPHGINLHQAFNVYQTGVSACRASGTAEWNEQWSDYSVNVDLDGQASLDLYSYLKERLPRVEGMLSFAGLSVPLRWGEVVPLYFALHQLASKTQAKGVLLKKVSIQSSPRVVIIAQPMRGTTAEERNSYIEKQSSTLIKFGRLLRCWCNQSSRRILLVISGDQAHTHAWSPHLPIIYQPDPSCFSKFPQAGTEHSKLFDNTIADWITGKRVKAEDRLYYLDQKLSVDEAGSLEKFALSCGYVGSLTLQGLMENEPIENRIDGSLEPVNPRACWLLNEFISACPTYYGMMAALFLRPS